MPKPAQKTKYQAPKGFISATRILLQFNLSQTELYTIASRPDAPQCAIFLNRVGRATRHWPKAEMTEYLNGLRRFDLHSAHILLKHFATLDVARKAREAEKESEHG